MTLTLTRYENGAVAAIRLCTRSGEIPAVLGRPPVTGSVIHGCESCVREQLPMPCPTDLYCREVATT